MTKAATKAAKLRRQMRSIALVVLGAGSAQLVLFLVALALGERAGGNIFEWIFR